MTTPLDLIRGHQFYPDEATLDAIPELYATERTALHAKVIHLHFFIGACDWWIAELGEDRRIAFGYVNLGDPQCAEWGYIDLAELSTLEVRHPAGFRLVVERDLHSMPRRCSEIGGVW